MACHDELNRNPVPVEIAFIGVCRWRLELAGERYQYLPVKWLVATEKVTANSDFFRRDICLQALVAFIIRILSMGVINVDYYILDFK